VQAVRPAQLSHLCVTIKCCLNLQEDPQQPNPTGDDSDSMSCSEERPTLLIQNGQAVKRLCCWCVYQVFRLQCAHVNRQENERHVCGGMPGRVATPG
jgi:hypothetical protein